MTMKIFRCWIAFLAWWTKRKELWRYFSRGMSTEADQLHLQLGTQTRGTGVITHASFNLFNWFLSSDYIIIYKWHKLPYLRDSSSLGGSDPLGGGGDSMPGLAGQLRSKQAMNDLLAATIRSTEERVVEVRRRAEEAVQEVTCFLYF